MKPQCSDTVSAKKEISFGSLHLLDIKRKGLDFLILQESFFFFLKRQSIYNSSKIAKIGK